MSSTPIKRTPSTIATTAPALPPKRKVITTIISKEEAKANPSPILEHKPESLVDQLHTALKTSIYHPRTLEEYEDLVCKEKLNMEEEEEESSTEPVSITEVKEEEEVKDEDDDNEKIVIPKKRKCGGNGGSSKKVKSDSNTDDIDSKKEKVSKKVVKSSSNIVPEKYLTSMGKKYKKLVLDKVFKIELVGNICGGVSYDNKKSYNLTINDTVVSSVSYKIDGLRTKKISIKDSSETIPEWKKTIIDEVTEFINKCFIIDREDITKVRVVVFPYKEHGKICVKYWCNEKRPIMLYSNGSDDTKKVDPKILDDKTDLKEIDGKLVKLTITPDNICLQPDDRSNGSEKMLNVLVNVKVV